MNIQICFRQHRDLKSDNILITDFLRAKVSDFGTSRAKDLSQYTMTQGVGTPLFAAPELMRGEYYDETVDIYSFGMLLISMAVEGNMLDFITWRYGQMTQMKNKDVSAIVGIEMWRKGWRPVTNAPENGLLFAPSSIEALLIRCCSHEAKARPNFTEILDLLVGECSLEISRANSATFKRWKFEEEHDFLRSMDGRHARDFNDDDESDCVSSDLESDASGGDTGGGQVPMTMSVSGRSDVRSAESNSMPRSDFINPVARDVVLRSRNALDLHQASDLRSSVVPGITDRSLGINGNLRNLRQPADLRSSVVPVVAVQSAFSENVPNLRQPLLEEDEDFI